MSRSKNNRQASFSGKSPPRKPKNTEVRPREYLTEDEVRQLAKAINDLLQRIENGFKREKQFTSDASHELRTPLAAIRGTLEILIRKRRESAHYEEKISQVIQEVDKMHLLHDILNVLRLRLLHRHILPPWGW